MMAEPSLPLVAMMDFLDDVSVEEQVLRDVAIVKSFMLTPEKPIPQEVCHTLSVHLRQGDRSKRSSCLALAGL